MQPQSHQEQRRGKNGFLYTVIPPYMWWECLHVLLTSTAMLIEPLAPGKVTHARQVKGQEKDES
jgi:hypothetical protein